MIRVISIRFCSVGSCRRHLRYPAPKRIACTGPLTRGRPSAGATAVGSPSGPNDLAPAVQDLMGAVACATAGGACSRASAADRSAPGARGTSSTGPFYSRTHYSCQPRRWKGRAWTMTALDQWRAWTVLAQRWSAWAVAALTGSGRYGNWGAGNPAVDGRVHGGFSWVTVGGRQRQPDGPCSVEAETARLVRGRTGISANGCVLVLERTADGVGPDRGQVKEQAGHPRSRSGRPAGGVPAAGPRARSRRECVRRRQARSAMPWARTRVAGGAGGSPVPAGALAGGAAPGWTAAAPRGSGISKAG